MSGRGLPTNEDLMVELHAISARLDRGDKRFAELDEKLRHLSGVTEAAATLETVAQTWKLASLGGRIVKWMASVAAAIGALWVLLNDGPKA